MRIVILVTCPSSKVAARIGRALVGEKLAACVSALPGVVSIFAWKGRIDRAKEVLMLAKTRRSLFEKARRRIRELHPYDTPEIVALPISAGDARYLSWIDRETRP